MDESAACDRISDALAQPYRRQLLVDLLEHNPQSVDGATSDPSRADHTSGGSNDDHVESISARHNHLPRLEDHGYIDWDSNAGAVTKGENWDEIVPVLHLLRSRDEDVTIDDGEPCDIAHDRFDQDD